MQSGVIADPITIINAILLSADSYSASIVLYASRSGKMTSNVQQPFRARGVFSCKFSRERSS
ncbi:protein of unknown function [Hyphomicrobium sp. MC1]|nr:protein of unknown function [Hyphomicrobium sp. MC1]